ncbi:hypothetical protein L5D93_07900 [Paenibacillus thiaminolyticus]|nr:hypothetical protein [Paenibacillus thiaminolyticus]
MKGREKAEACGNTVTNQVTKKMRRDGMAELSGKPKVLILGSFHMKAKADLFATEPINLLSPQRHQEIMEVVKRILAFRPTKIARA